MVLHRSFGATVITEDNSFRVLELGWHWLLLDLHIKVPEVRLHVDSALVAYWTLVGCFHVLHVAVLMDAMSAGIDVYHSFPRREHVLPTYRAVAVGNPLDAFVGLSYRHWFTDATRLSSC